MEASARDPLISPVFGGCHGGIVAAGEPAPCATAAGEPLHSVARRGVATTSSTTAHAGLRFTSIRSPVVRLHLGNSRRAPPPWQLPPCASTLATLAVCLRPGHHRGRPRRRGLGQRGEPPQEATDGSRRGGWRGAATSSIGHREIPLSPLSPAVSHPILQGKPNASHVCARINLHTHDRQKECNTIAVIKRMRVKLIQYSLLHSDGRTQRSKHKR
jgi:hypothetical protein